MQTKSNITSLQFGLFSPAEIKGISVLHIIHPETIENSVPKENGLADPRMGSSDYSMLCSSCLKNSQDCMGHFGHIELTKPVFHVGYLSRIKKVLECVCFYCSSIKSVKRDENGILVVAYVVKSLSGNWSLNKTKSICETCGNKQPIIKREGLNLLAFMKASDTEGKILLTPEKVYSIFKKIVDEDITALGFNRENSRPEYMILTTIIVAPPCTRPAIVMDGLRSEDDLTHKYADIIKSNINLKKYESEGAPTHILRDYEQLLQFHVATLMDNDISGQPQALQKSGRPLKSLSARLKGKEGRLRYNLMGKRVDFSARTVITPDPNLSLEQVGVPISIAMIHTSSETVNSMNIDALQMLVDAGPNVHPGANYVIRTDGQRIDLRFNRTEIHLQEGYVVERHLSDGDTVLFNRQPSLHKMSMMAHSVKVMEKKTFRLNLSVTSPYNADFDGDEMNLHAPQSLLCISELRELASVPTQIVSPQSNRPVMGIVQDSLVGVRKLTLNDVFVTEHEAMILYYNSIFSDSLNSCDELIKNNFMQNTDLHDNDAKETHNSHFMPFPTVLRPKKLYTGRQIFSWALPPINYRGTGTDEKEVLVVDGYLHLGVIDKKSVGTAEGGIIHIIFNDFGKAACVRFFNSVQHIVNTFLTTISTFSIGIGDTVPSRVLQKEITKCITDAQNDVASLIEDSSNLTRSPGMSLFESFESKINIFLNRARSSSGSAAQGHLSFCNNAKAMTLAGSKGSIINISQMTACVGQQNVEGKRIPFGFKNRTLPHFPQDDYSPKSRGFVENSYLTGLTPEEFYFHAMGGREGLIDTAVKTAETGYIQRRLVKAMEDLKIEYDHSVRSSNGIVQFVYGDDGYRGEAIERQSVFTKKKVNITSEDSYDFYNESKRTESGDILKSQISHALKALDIKDEAFMDHAFSLLEWCTDEVISEVLDNLKTLFDEFNTTKKDQTFYLPCNLKRLFWNVRRNIQSTQCNITVLDLKNFITQLESFILKNMCTVKKHAIYASKNLIEYIKQNFTMSNILSYKMNHKQLKYISEIFKEKFFQALAVTNEMVGILSAQSVGEPATQMTLNTFHLAGVASTVTLGVPRLKEIINIAKTLKTPSMRVYLKDQYNSSLNAARQAQIELEYTCIKDVLESIQLVYDPEITDTVIEDDKDFVSLYYLCPDEMYDNESLYVIRLLPDREKMVGRGITLNLLISTLKQMFPISSVIATDENSDKLIVRVRSVKISEEENLSIMQNLINQKLVGYKGVKKAFIITEKTRGYNNGHMKNDEIYALQTEGVNVKELLGSELIIPELLYSNDINEIYSVFGIEAAREVILTELRKVIENESYVNYRHLSLLSDVITNKGILTGITRHGVNKTNKSALMRCSFEETVEILLEAAVNGERSNCKEVTENIIIGQTAPVGTGCTEIFLNCEKLKDAVPVAKKMVFDFEKGEFGTPEMLSPISQSSSWSPMTQAGNTPGYAINTAGYSNSIGSPSFGSNILPGHSYSPTSPTYSPTSPTYSPTSPTYSPTSPTYSPTSPTYSPTSPTYSPTSPTYSPTSPGYTPSAYNFSPTSPAYIQGNPSAYSPTNPNNVPFNLHKRPTYLPSSPFYAQTPANTDYVPTNPAYNVLSPKYKEKKDDKNNQEKE